MADNIKLTIYDLNRSLRPTSGVPRYSGPHGTVAAVGDFALKVYDSPEDRSWLSDEELGKRARSEFAIGSFLKSQHFSVPSYLGLLTVKARDIAAFHEPAGKLPEKSKVYITLMSRLFETEYNNLTESQKAEAESQYEASLEEARQLGLIPPENTQIWHNTLFEPDVGENGQLHFFDFFDWDVDMKSKLSLPALKKGSGLVEKVLGTNPVTFRDSQN